MARASQQDLREEQAIAALKALEGVPLGADGPAVVGKALEAKAARVVAVAVRLVAEHELVGLVARLGAVYERFSDDAVKRDPGCRAKQAVVEALVRLERDPDDVLVRAVRYRQLEPAWGKPVDTATSLRAHAALGLANLGVPGAANEIAALLADEDWVARAGAVRALGALPATICEPLLRYKALAGDDEPRVLGECFAALLVVDAAASLAFVAGFLDGKDVVAEQAAIALGESRGEAALARLCAWRERIGGSRLERVALVAIGLVRSDASRDHLLGVLREGEPAAAAHAAEALAILRHDPRARELILAAARARKDRALLARVQKALEP